MTVMLAARIAAQAQGGEILVSASLSEVARCETDLVLGTERTLELKGISEPQRAFVIAWR
jgi:class 3 adenylate cyclase